MGATPTREDADATLNISIHAPAWGATGSPPLTRGKGERRNPKARFWGSPPLTRGKAKFNLCCLKPNIPLDTPYRLCGP